MKLVGLADELEQTSNHFHMDVEFEENLVFGSFLKPFLIDFDLVTIFDVDVRIEGSFNFLMLREWLPDLIVIII